MSGGRRRKEDMWTRARRKKREETQVVGMVWCDSHLFGDFSSVCTGLQEVEHKPPFLKRKKKD